jgi:protein-S-isoprenylcysteine O-methyltransferase Ste14
VAPPDSGPSDKKHEGVRQSGADAVSLSVRYLKQETLTVVKGLKGYLLYGIAGSLLVTIGVVLLLVSFLRLLQTEAAPTFTGNTSWLPYLIVLVTGLLIIGLCVWLIVNGARRRSARRDSDAATAKEGEAP